MVQQGGGGRIINISCVAQVGARATAARPEPALGGRLASLALFSASAGAKARRVDLASAGLIPLIVPMARMVVKASSPRRWMDMSILKGCRPSVGVASSLDCVLAHSANPRAA